MPAPSSLFVAAAALLASTTSASASPPCYGPYDRTSKLETPCARILASSPSDSLTIRAYVNGVDVHVAEYAIPASVTTYQEAFELGAYTVVGYFVGYTNAKNESLLTSRTVPLVLRPPTAHNKEWLARMALAPSLWPPTRKVVEPTYNVTLAPLTNATIAVQYRLIDQSPQPSDLAALCKELDTNVAKLGGWTVDPTSPFTYSHAYFNGRDYDMGPFDIECYAGVVKA
jgi:hypothetical protein